MASLTAGPTVDCSALAPGTSAVAATAALLAASGCRPIPQGRFSLNRCNDYTLPQEKQTVLR